MCIICVSPSGVRQPSVSTMFTMFRRNPHGAGYMFARDGKVTIHKGCHKYYETVLYNGMTIYALHPKEVKLIKPVK